MEVSEKSVSNHRDFLMIGLLVALILTFLMWANFTRLDLVTRGSGRVIAIGENKNVQTSERGIIKEYLIKKGQSVAKNQVIAKINPIEAEGVLEELNSRLTTLNAKLTRIDGELNLISLESMKAKLSIFPEEVMRAELDLFEARKLEYQAIIEGKTKDKSKIEKDAFILKSEIKGLKKLKELLDLEMSEVIPLVEEGIIGKSEKFRLEREQTKMQTELGVLREREFQNKFEVEKIETEITAVEKKITKDLYENRSNVIGEISQLEARIPSLSQRLTETEIRSPISGVANRVFFNSKGAVLKEGDIIAEIVPSGSGLQIEAFIDPKDIGFIEPGQRAKISLTAYDASKYGYIKGTLIQIAADTVFREETKSPQYSVTISIDEKIFEDETTIAEIFPGMIAQVDIIRGSRSVIEYFWQPVAKLKDNAFRE